MNTKKDCCEKPVFCRCMEHGGKCHNCGKQRFQDEVVIVPSGRIDWCGDCQAEHGYECPKDSHTDSTKKCCGGIGPMGKCGRGTKGPCSGAHCRCMQKDCTNMHYVDCKEHYTHIEHIEKEEYTPAASTSVSQDKETVDDKLSKPDNSYIDQVVEEFRNSFANAGGDYDGPLTPLETFLREKLRTNIEHEVRMAYDCAVYVLPSGEILINPKEAAYEGGKTAERQRIREIVEEEQKALPEACVREWNMLSRLLARLSED